MKCLLLVTDAGDIDTNTILRRCDTATDLRADYLKRAQAVCFNRDYIVCEEGNGKIRKLAGIASLDSKVGDVVCILFGCSVPCVLQPFWDARWRESQPEYYKLIGEAFVLGKMDGEALDGLTEKELAGEDFSFEVKRCFHISRVKFNTQFTFTMTQKPNSTEPVLATRGM